MPVTPTRAAFLAVLGALAALAAPASAHHAISDQGIAWVEPVSVIELDYTTAGLDHHGSTELFHAVGLLAEYAPLPWLSGYIRAPFAVRHGMEGQAVYGVGDIDLAMKGRLFETNHGEIILSAGLGVRLPAGSPDDELGTGYLAVLPFVAASSSPTTDLIFYTAIGATVQAAWLREPAPAQTANDGHSHSHDDEHSHDDTATTTDDSHLNVARHELLWTLDVAYLFEPMYASVGLSSTFAIDGSGVSGPFAARATVGVVLSEMVRLSLTGEVPFAGDLPYYWRTRLAAAVMF